jgi:hypothetical protein
VAAVLLATVVTLVVVWVQQAPGDSLFFWRSDLTADETKRALQRGNPSWRNVQCIHGSDGWDYICSYTYSSGGRDLRDEIGVDVDSRSPIRRSAP